MTQAKFVEGRRWRREWPWMIVGAGCAVVTLSKLFLPLAGLVALVGWLVCVLLGVALAQRWERPPRFLSPTLLEMPFAVAQDFAVFERYQKLTQSLLDVSRHNDPLYREIALEQLDRVVARTAEIAAGTLVFEGTEAWRIVYERLLRSFGLYQYRSVAWIKNAQYWQDEPGRKSLAVNFELLEEERLDIERIAIIADALWPVGALWPDGLVHHWLREQHARGIGIKFVRESALKNEPELIADIGIYGARAVGVQELDDQCRTVRFMLTFDFDQVRAAEERWQRLSVYAESFENYVDRFQSAS
jgi:hypothetical protein